MVTAGAILTQFLSLLRRKTFEASWWRTALTAATAYVARTGKPLPKRGTAAPALLPEAKVLFLTHFVTFLPEIMSSISKGSLFREHTNKPMPWTRRGDRLCGGN